MKSGGRSTGLKLVERPKQVEASLWRRLRFENEAACREALFSVYHSLARGIAIHEFRRRPPYGLERADFEHLAFEGLLEAIDRFDPLRGAPFDAFARPRIRGPISDGLARSSENGAQYSHRRRVELERLRSLGSKPEENVDDYIAELSDVAVALAIGLVAESAGSFEEDRAADEVPATGYDSVGWRELQLSVLREIERLPDTERSMLQQHYLKGVSFKHIAEILGVSKSRVSQLHRAALRKIRLRLRSAE